jgi:hypothetical protein
VGAARVVGSAGVDRVAVGWPDPAACDGVGAADVAEADVSEVPAAEGIEPGLGDSSF